MVKQVHPAKRLLKVIVAVLLPALVFGSLAQAAPAISPVRDSAVYGLNVFPQELKICVGEEAVIKVTVPLVVTKVDNIGVEHNVNLYHVGEGVLAKVLPPAIGTIRPSGLETTVAGSQFFDEVLFPLVSNIYVFTETPINLLFEITGDKKGTTQIRFEHEQAARPYSHAIPVEVQLEVVDCWEAYATGLFTGNVSNEWTKKDICSLERPFVLEGNGSSAAFGTRTDAKSLAFFFWPSREPFGVLGLTALQDGRYIYGGLTTITSPDGRPTSCTSVGSGSYQLFIYDSRTPIEGNLVLYGSVDTYCEGRGFHTPQDAIQVAFRALGAGQACQELWRPGLNP